MKLIVFVLFFFVGTAYAGTQNALPSCYDALRLPKGGGGVETEVFVMIDQTTPLDLNLKQSVADNLKTFLKAGNNFSILVFSAFVQSHYTDVLVTGQLEQPLDLAKRNETSKPVLAKFDQCLSAQEKSAIQLAGNGLRQGFSGTTSAIAKSDVLAALKDLSVKIKQSNAKRKIVLLVSDMLENSTVTSFYLKQVVRKIEVEKEMKLVVSNQLIGDFSNAEFYVIGAGTLSEDGVPKGVYRDSKVMGVLESFWREYFTRSKGNLIEFGKPMLLNSVR